MEKRQTNLTNETVHWLNKIVVENIEINCSLQKIHVSDFFVVSLWEKSRSRNQQSSVSHIIETVFLLPLALMTCGIEECEYL